MFYGIKENVFYPLLDSSFLCRLRTQLPNVSIPLPFICSITSSFIPFSYTGRNKWKACFYSQSYQCILHCLNIFSAPNEFAIEAIYIFFTFNFSLIFSFFILFNFCPSISKSIWNHRALTHCTLIKVWKKKVHLLKLLLPIYYRKSLSLPIFPLSIAFFCFFEQNTELDTCTLFVGVEKDFVPLRKKVSVSVSNISLLLLFRSFTFLSFIYLPFLFSLFISSYHEIKSCTHILFF